jgi:hypothetical protein
MLGRGMASLALAAAVACGSGGGGAGDDAGSGDDGASAGDAGSPDAAGPVRLARAFVFAHRAQYTSVAFGTDTEGPGSCVVESVAGCELQTCVIGTPAPPAPTAGAVTITSPDGDFLYTPDDQGAYPTAPAVTWNPGDTVSVAATGDSIAAFTASVTGPASITSVSAPEFNGGVVVPRDQPLAFAWDGADAGVNAVVRCEAETLYQLRCVFPAGVMSSAVPAEALGRLPACPAAGLFLLTEDRTVVSAGDLTIRFAARGPMFSGNATLE